MGVPRPKPSPLELAAAQRRLRLGPTIEIIRYLVSIDRFSPFPVSGVALASGRRGHGRSRRRSRGFRSRRLGAVRRVLYSCERLFVVDVLSFSFDRQCNFNQAADCFRSARVIRFGSNAPLGITGEICLCGAISPPAGDNPPGKIMAYSKHADLVTCFRNRRVTGPKQAHNRWL